MLEKESMKPQVIRKMEEMEGGRRTTGISSIKETKNIQDIRAVPDPEVSERAVRRRFTEEYKLQYPQGSRILHGKGATRRPVTARGTLLNQSHCMETSDGERDVGSPVTPQKRAKS